MKHKHADLIHAWADGAEIEFKHPDGQWIDCTNSLDWGYGGFEYRIKPQEKKPVVRWLWAFVGGTYTNNFLTEEEAKKFLNPLTKLEWSRTEFPE